VPTFSADYLARLARTTGFRSDTLEKVLRLGRALDQVGRHPFLGERLALKHIQWGEFPPELVVDDDPELLARVRRHPMLLWKAENGRKRRRPGPDEGLDVARSRGR
jgi:hypothetical protein